LPKPTIKQVAAEAEVSTATVSRVLNDSGYASKEIRERVLETVAKLNYQPNAIARSLKQDKTFMIGVVVPDISNPYFMGISRGVEDVVGPEGFQLMFCSSDESREKEGNLLKMLHEKRVDAILLATSGGNDHSLKLLADSGVPVVLVDRKPESEEDGTRLDFVGEDNVEGAAQLTRRLLEKGHVRIGVVNGPIRASTGRERLEGVLRAMKEYQLAPDPIVYNGDFTTESGILAVRKFLAADPKPTAIVSLNNAMSLGVLLEIVRCELKIPEDIAVASFGEVEAGLLLKRPKLYFIDQHPYEMGVRAGEILLGRIRKLLPSAPVFEVFHHDVHCML